MNKYFIDTCIWRDFYEDRISRTGRLLGKDANNLFKKILKRKDKILFSETLIWELNKDYDNQEINDMLNLLFMNNSLIRIDITKAEHLEAKKLAKRRKIPYVDCLNAIQARNHNAIMVSQDRHFIDDLSDITKTVRPDKIN
jgi:PIN domain nuclease of toxin-antitoxin system